VLGLRHPSAQELALSNVPQQTIVLLEDIDAAFVQRRAGDQTRGGGVSFSGLLNAIDGVGSGEQRVVFMTTNFIERLDPALIRPGRVDMVQLIDFASEVQVAQLFRGFYPTELEEVRKTPPFGGRSHVCHKKRSFCEDRLGKNKRKYE
jgi:chaperone BCS1